MKRTTRFISLFLVMTMVFSVNVMAATATLQIYENGDSENSVGTCEITYTTNENVTLVDSPSNTDPTQDGSLQINSVTGGTVTVYSFGDALFNPVIDVSNVDSQSEANNATAKEQWDSDHTTHYEVETGYNINTNSNQWVFQAIMNYNEGHGNGLPTTYNGSISHVSHMWSMDGNPDTWKATSMCHGTYSPSAATVESVENRDYSNGDSRPATNNNGPSVETVQQSLVRNSLTQISEALPLASPEIKQQLMEVGFNLNMQNVGTVDAVTVKSLIQNNTIPYNIIYTYQGQAFSCRVPAGFDFTPFIKADGTINLSELLGYLIQENAKAEAAKANTRTRTRRR